MRFLSVCHLIAILLMLFSLTMLPPLCVDYYYQESLSGVYWFAFFVSLLSGLILWLLTRHRAGELKTRDGFLVVVLFWMILSLYGMIPFVIGEAPPLNFLDGLFESVSGWTTTGATMVSGIEFFPHSLQYYRQQLQFLGGMGIIVLAVAVLPMLGVGGMQLYQAEMPGPIKDHKLTPRIAETAKVLWVIYCGLTLVCFLLYHFEGLSWFNAIGEAFSTVATGGFSMHDSSFSYYQSPGVHATAMLFMVLSSLNYSLHYLVFRKGSWGAYLHDIEARRFLCKVLGACVLVSFGLWFHEHYEHGWETFQYAAFQTISIMTTTGLTTDNYHEWPKVLSLLLMFLGVVGGCAASTCGGIKTIRLLILRRQGSIALRKMIHPHGVFSMRLGDKPITEEVASSVSAFIYVFVTLFILLQLTLMALGLSYKTAFGCLVATLANVGVGVGDILPNFAHLSNPCKMVLIVAMLAGRLEIFTLLVLFVPNYWRK